MSVSSRPASSGIDVQVTLIARRLACEPCWSRDGSSRAASARPDATALETPRGSWSYAQLHGAASAGAAQLGGAGAGRGSRIAIALPAGLELAQAIHACLLLGAVAVPVDLRLSQTERDAICAGAQVLIDEPLDSARATDGAPAGEPARSWTPPPS